MHGKETQRIVLPVTSMVHYGNNTFGRMIYIISGEDVVKEGGDR